MLKKITYFLCALALVLATSCSPDDETIYLPSPPAKPFASGIIYYGSSIEDLGFYAPASKMSYPGNIFKSMNAETVGVVNANMEGGINDLAIYNGKAYLLTPKSGEGVGETRARIAVTNAGTFTLEKSIYADGFDPASLGNIYSMAVVNENKIYVSYNDYASGNTSGVGMLDVAADGSTTFTKDLEGTTGSAGIDGPGMFQRMLKTEKWVAVPCGYMLKFIDTTINQVDETKTIEFDPARQVADVLKGCDGNIYALVAGAAEKDDMWEMGWTQYDGESSIVKINPSTLKVVEEFVLYDEDNEQLDISSGMMEANGAVASLTTNEIIFKVGMTMMMGYIDIYAYNFSTKTTRYINRTSGMTRKYMATDKLGNLYLPYSNGIYDFSSTKTEVIRISDGEHETGIEARFQMFKGDGGFISTYMF